MKASERDQLLQRQVQAAETQAQLSQRLVEALERPEKARRRAELDITFASSPRRFLNGESGLRAMAKIPGFAALFADKIVPESHLLQVDGRHGEPYTILRCVCGAHTVLKAASVDECSGACGRWFLSGRRSIYVHKFAQP
jgi:hypothetical protein